MARSSSIKRGADVAAVEEETGQRAVIFFAVPFQDDLRVHRGPDEGTHVRGRGLAPLQFSPTAWG